MTRKPKLTTRLIDLDYLPARIILTTQLTILTASGLYGFFSGIHHIRDDGNTTLGTYLMTASVFILAYATFNIITLLPTRHPKHHTPTNGDTPTASTTPKRGPNTTPRTPQSNTPPKPPQTQKHTTPHTSPHTEAKHDPLLPGDNRTRQ